MLVSNFCFDWVFFVGGGRWQTGALDWFARAIAGLFITLAGLSLSLSQARRPGFAGVWRRGLRLLGLGLMITLATRQAVGAQMVVFGVLHLIGLGLILAYPLVNRPRLSLALGLTLPLLAGPVGRLTIDSPWLLWLGLRPPDFASVDYTPLIPWLGPLLVGVFLGQTLYPAGRRRFRLAAAPAFLPSCRWLVWAGRHSLIIYFAHQPLFLGGLLLARRWALP